MRLPTKADPLPCPARRPAFTLLEILVVMGAMGIVMLLATATLLGAFRIQGGVAAVFQRLTVQAALADQFRQDVDRATAAPDRFDNQSANSTCLILRMANGAHVVYRWDAHKLTRSEFAARSKSERVLPLGGNRATVEFIRAAADPRRVTLLLREPRGQPPRARHPLEISATLGSDLQ